jgi:predicted RNase H-like nuclease (RuvC/YqgF family)
MQDFILPILTTLATALITWFFARRKNDADAKSAEIDNEVKSASFYQNLLDDSKKRLDECLAVIETQNKRISERDKIIESQDAEKRLLQQHIKELMDSNETLITELKKFRQLNGKTN